MNCPKASESFLDRLAPGRTWIFLLRQDARRARIFERLLEGQNRTASNRIVADSGPVVSLTSYGVRLRTVHLAIESIARGAVLPSRVILWVEDAGFVERMTEPLRRLQARGLEIRLCPDYGPHKKYYPYVQSTESYDRPLVTADDDVLYPRNWLQGLVNAYERSPNVLNCWRARTMLVTEDGIAPYAQWPDCSVSAPSFLHFATGVSGSIFPARLLRQLRKGGKAFMESCPRADDVWIHVNALRAGVQVRQIDRWQKDYPEIAGSQAVSLASVNNGQRQNDAQIASSYTSEDQAKLRSSAPETTPPEEPIVAPS